MPDTIHIALAADDNYFEGLLTTAWSIVRNCSRPKSLVFHILDGGIDDEHWQVLKNRISSFGCSLQQIRIDQTKSFGSFKSYHGGGKMTYARLLLPDLLPNVKQIIYSDVDILWAVDIAELWDALDPSAIIHCTPSNLSSPLEIEWCNRYGYTFERGTRFCAGMIVLNLDKFRSEDLHHKMLAALEACGGKAPCNDETVLNALVFGRKDRGFLPSRWQHMSAGQTKPLESNGCVIHYLMDTPWQSIHKYHHLLTDAHILWHRFHAEARQISVWQSMRMPNSALDIIMCRALFLCARYCGLVRGLLRLMLTLTGKRSNISALNAYMLPFDFKNVNLKLLPQTLGALTPTA